MAVGLEGSDFSKRHRRAEWRTIPEDPFTADVTAPFQVYGDGDAGSFPARFDVVTSWEMIEHIAEPDLKQVAENVGRHLKESGIWVMSISPNIEIIDGVPLHQTVQPRDWWVTKFQQLGWTHLESHLKYFNTQFVRGPKYGAPGSFHLVLSRNPASVPPVPTERLAVRYYDAWLGSRWHQWLKLLVVGVDHP